MNVLASAVAWHEDRCSMWELVLRLWHTKPTSKNFTIPTVTASTKSQILSSFLWFCCLLLYLGSFAKLNNQSKLLLTNDPTLSLCWIVQTATDVSQTEVNMLNTLQILAWQNAQHWPTVGLVCHSPYSWCQLSSQLFYKYLNIYLVKPTDFFLGDCIHM